MWRGLVQSFEFLDASYVGRSGSVLDFLVSFSEHVRSVRSHR